jgi:hypothetical protein
LLPVAAVQSFDAVTWTHGENHSFLGMNIIAKPDGVSVDMTAYTEKCVKDQVQHNVAKTPARDDLFVDTESTKLSSKQREIFHTAVARLFCGGGARTPHHRRNCDVVKNITMP